MRRRNPAIPLLAILVAIALGSVLLVRAGGVGERSFPPCPPACNVVLISIDTLRADHTGFHGYARDTTPNLDRIARESVVFENAISQSAWTTPAHASMMTGLYPFEHGLIYYRNPGRLPEGTDTLARILAERGYRTVGFNGGGFVSASFGLDAGFERYEGTRFFRHNVDASLRWLQENRDDRFLLFLHAYDVHRPYLAPEPFDRWWEGEPTLSMKEFCADGTQTLRGERDRDYVVSQYDAGIRYTDFVIGQLLDALREWSLLDRTLLVVTSDHGDELFEHGACDHIKSVYQELVHVPLVVRLPSAARRRIATAVPASVSVTPTVLDLLEIEHDLPDDRSLAAWVRGAEGTAGPVLSETGRVGASGRVRYWRGLTVDGWKLIVHRDDRVEAERLELYDLGSDPIEQRNLAGEDPARAGRMRASLLRPPVSPAPSRGSHAIDPQTAAALEALGYVE